MNTDFWLARWNRNEIGFHQQRPNEYLVAYWPAMRVPAGVTVFVPLCGKSLDMRWLHEHAGHPVLGVELARQACEDFFREWGVEPAITHRGPFEQFSAREVTLLCGDFFALAPADLAGVGAVFDRAALIALPTAMRVTYAKKMREVLPARTPMLLVAPDYAQSEMSGPPFAVNDEEVRALFAGCTIDALATFDVSDAPENSRFRQRGLSRLVERVFRIE